MTDRLTLDPRRTALVLIDPQVLEAYMGSGTAELEGIGSGH